MRAAGGLVWRQPESGPTEIVIVHRPAYGDWSFPKGKLESGETERAAAIREVEEETGITGRLGADLGHASYRDKAGRPKTVRYFRMTPKSGTLTPSNEVDDAKWISVDDVTAVLTYWHDREIVNRFVSTPFSDAATVYLVRHAKAGDRAAWTDPDEERPLTGPGRKQAERLVAVLDDDRISRLVSSPYVRCTQTLEPLSAATGLEIETSDTLAEGASIHDVTTLLEPGTFAGSMVLCTHGDVMMELVGHLLNDGVPLRGDEIAYRKASTWVLKVRDGAIASARYLEPPSS